ncbi:hypothetical protein H2200_000673 [Cladophialophora chaetospira]|uniref:Myb/SANT-like domain-containing protein n=1 Tax=Cladophialophora chaetospira TaxID=386627 RepID=A0AA38XNX0_9EURO|nr:hypothetical protein H2200_000673 [Cladophialophora chaetospira]
MTKRAVWTPDRLDLMYQALDESNQNGSGSASWTEACQLIEKKTGFTSQQVVAKIRSLGQKHNPKLSREAFVQNWSNHSAFFRGGSAAKGRQSPRRSGTSGCSSSRASQRGRQSPTATNNLNNGAAAGPRQTQSPKEQPEGLASAKGRDIQSERDDQTPVGQHLASDGDGDEDGEDEEQEDQDYDEEEEDEEDEQGERENEGLLLSAKEGEMIHAYRSYRHTRHFEPAPLSVDIEIRLREVLRSLDRGINAFAKAHPIAHLTTARMTRAPFELARQLLPGPSRTQIEEALRTLFSDPALNVSLVLRGFAIAAVTTWVFQEFPEYEPPSAESALNQNLDIFAEYIPPAARDVREALELNFFEEVVEPTFPALVLEYRAALFDILFSLRVPPEPLSDLPEGQSPEKAPGFAFRQKQQSEWAKHIDKAFLDALNLRSLLAKSSNVFKFKLLRQGERFDAERMTPMIKMYVKANTQHRVLLGLSPVVSCYDRVFGRASTLVSIKAKVALEGFEVDPVVADMVINRPNDP